MRFHSMPKPVRVRIESGGEEHFSLDSLLVRFNPTDLLERRNELLRWLEFQGKEGERIVQELSNITDFNKDIFGLYRVFFHNYMEDNGIETLEELYSHWSQNETYSNNYSFLKDYLNLYFELGGRKHSDLYSLLQSFDPIEITPIREADFRYWLSFQGTEGKRIVEWMRINHIADSDIEAVYKVFFHNWIKQDENFIENLYALLSIERNVNFQNLRRICLDDDVLIERLYLNDRTRDLEKDWLEILEGFVMKHYTVKTDDSTLGIVSFEKQVKNPNLFYYLGTQYIDNNVGKAKWFLRTAIERGTTKDAQSALDEAIKISEKDIGQSGGGRFDDVDKKKIEIYISSIFRYWTKNWETLNNCLKDLNECIPPLTDKERKILQLVFDYKKACQYAVGYERPSKRYKAIKKFTSNIDAQDFLCQEKIFILNISGYQEGGSIEVDSRKEMKLLSESYIPARYMVDKSYSNVLLDKGNFRFKNVPERVELVLRNMFSFEE